MANAIRISVGPSLPEFGSWIWLGEGLVQALQPKVDISTFDSVTADADADIIVFVKFLPSITTLRRLNAEGRKVVYLPVDIYGSSREIDDDIQRIRFCDLIILHCRRLTRYFNAMGRSEYVDHPLKFVLGTPRVEFQDGPLVWIGRRCNLAPVVQWANSTALKNELWILTDFDGKRPTPQELGFRTTSTVRIEQWCVRTHMEWTSQASLAIDIKGTDFRSRHKPPAKAFDFMASGVPVLTNPGSSLSFELMYKGLQASTDPCVLENTSLFTPDYLESHRKACETAEPCLVWSRMEQLLMELVS